MAPTRRTWLAAIAASASLAGCIGGDDSDDGDDDSSGDTNSTDGDSDDGNGESEDGSDGGDGEDDSDGGDGNDGDDGDSSTISTAEHDDHGEILVDGEGMTLYMFDSDEQGSGESTCSEGCAENWPPLTVEGDPTADDAVTAELTTFERGDGSTQVAANGWPLYYWQADAEPGDASGQGVNDVWWVLDPDGEQIR